MAKKVIVIGSGFGGLGTAVRLAAQGYEVEIFEKRDKPGGRGYVYEIDGFKFDGGPTVITAPFMFDDLYEVAGQKRSDHIEFVECDPFYRIFDPQGRPFNYNGDEAYIQEQIKQWNPADVEKIIPDLLKLQSHKSVYNYMKQFIQDDFLRQCFSFHPLLVGGNPFDTTSIYAMIHYLEREWGIHYAMGGTGAIVQGLVSLFEGMGGKIHYNAEVEEIIIENRTATGIRLKDNTTYKADHIVSNADVGFTYRNLINKKHYIKLGLW